MASLVSEGPGRLAGATDLERAFEDSLAESTRLAFRVAYGVLRQREDAEDVAQEAVARAHRKLPSLRDANSLRAWLVRISWRMALDHRRAGKRRERREQVAETPPAPPDAEQLAAGNEFRLRLWRAIDALPDKLRVVIVLAGVQGHDMAEVAALLQVPEGTVKSRLHVARRRLAERMR